MASRAAPLILIAHLLCVMAAGCSPADPAERLEQARRLRIEGEPVRAAIILSELVRDHPEDYTFNYELAAALHEGDHDIDALTPIAAAIDANPNSADARHLRAAILVELERDEEALNLLRRIVAAAPRRPGVHRLMGTMHARAGRIERAVNQFEKELSISPADAETLTKVGDLYLRAGRIDDAASRLERAVTASPDLSRAHQFLAEVRFKQGRKPEGLDAQRRAVDLAPENISLFVDHARALYNYGRAADSRRLLDEAMAHGNPEPLLLLEVARQLVDRMDFEAAIGRLEQVVAIAPELADPFFEMGKIYQMMGRNDEARKMFMEANRLSPFDPYAWYYLGALAAKAGHLDEAVRRFRKSLELDNKNPKAHYALGRALLRLGRREEAEAELARHAEILRILRERERSGVATMD